MEMEMVEDVKHGWRWWEEVKHVCISRVCACRCCRDAPVEMVVERTSCSRDSASNTASFLSTILIATRSPDSLWRPSFTTANEPLFGMDG